MVENTGLTDITSHLFKQILLETEALSEEGEVVDRRYYLVDVECFVGPMVVIPNIGATPKCKYFEMTPKAEWGEQFARWLDMDHKHDAMEMAPTESEDSSSADELESTDSAGS